MRFAAEIWLWGVFFALGLAAVLVVQGLRVSRARSRFGREEQVLSLLTAKTGIRRAVRGVLSCTAVALAFVAAAQPQYGKGTRVLPATNLDVVLVLDYSNCMYARDVSPSRISRAKVEVGKLVRELGGARFGAVAFAGESIAFPLTSDGGAIAQFFRGLEPNDLPIGGTAIARALESGRTLFERDPLSKNHERVMILITDGEDLEGDPVAVARTAAASGVRVEVVQIGGQSPEPIPVVDETGAVRGLRKDASGKILTTQLSVEGEAQLASVAAEGRGQVVRAVDGDVGIGEMTTRLQRLMTEELSERVETVYADIFHYPLVVAVLLLMIEVAVGSAPKRVIPREPPRERVRRRKSPRMRASTASFVLLVPWLSGCESVDRVFERESPQVNDAIEALRSSAPDHASQLLIEYLETGECEEGVIGVGARTRRASDAAYDLALALSAQSRVGAKKKEAPPSLLGGPPQATGGGVLGGPSGQSSTPPIVPGGAGADPSQEIEPAILHQIDCAIRLLAPIFEDRTKPVSLRARAHYLSGNLELLRKEYEAAVTSYDSAIRLAPGVAKGEGDPLGLAIAYNRALSLRLLQEKKEQEQEDDQNSSQEEQSEDESPEDNQDESDEQDGESDNSESEDEESESEKDDQERDESKEDEPAEENDDENSKSEEQDDSERDESQTDPPSPSKRETAAEESQENTSASRDERMLDLLEQAPTLQQHDAKQRKGQVRGRMTMEDK